MFDFLVSFGLKWQSFLWASLVLLCAISIWRQAEDLEANKKAWGNWQAYEPVLGATPWSYVTAPIYKLFRLLALDIFTTHAVFVVGTFGTMDHFWKSLMEQDNDFLAMFFILLNGIAWVNFAFPKYRPRFFAVVLGLFEAFSNKVTPGTFPPGQSPPGDGRALVAPEVQFDTSAGDPGPCFPGFPDDGGSPGKTY